jgi:hypothetical protein
LEWGKQKFGCQQHQPHRLKQSNQVKIQGKSHNHWESSMPFSNYKNIGTVLKEFQVKYTESDFVNGVDFSISDYFRDDLEMVMREGVVNNSEFAICENLIYPILKEVWKQYYPGFILWSHQSLVLDEQLSGFPEYILARRSLLVKSYSISPTFC